MKNYSNRAPRSNMSQHVGVRNDLGNPTRISAQMMLSGNAASIPQRGPNPLAPSSQAAPLYDPSHRFTTLSGNDKILDNNARKAAAAPTQHRKPPASYLRSHSNQRIHSSNQANMATRHQRNTSSGKQNYGITSTNVLPSDSGPMGSSISGLNVSGHPPMLRSKQSVSHYQRADVNQISQYSPSIA